MLWGTGISDAIFVNILFVDFQMNKIQEMHCFGPKYEYGSFLNTKINPLCECLIQIFFKDIVKLQLKEASYEPISYIMLLSSLFSVCLPNIVLLANFFLHSTEQNLKKTSNFMLTHVVSQMST